MAGTNQLRELFEKDNNRRHYPKGEIIIMQGNALDCAYLIESGIVRVIDFDQNGEQRTVALLTKHHIFPFSWLLSQTHEQGALYYYQALTNVTCYTANTDEVRDLVSNNTELAWKMVDILAKSYLNALSRLQNLQKTNVEEKVDFIIYYLAILLGKNIKGNKIEIDGNFTHQEIADLAGLTRESVSRQLKKEKYSHIIVKDSHGLMINLENLNTTNMPPIFMVNPK
jgi:CRP/FNR family cyclic AMP-dependent transcriptional regulator